MKSARGIKILGSPNNTMNARSSEGCRRMNKRLLSIPEFGNAFGPKHTKTYELIKRGELTAVKIGRRTYIPIEAAEAWAAGLPRL